MKMISVKQWLFNETFSVGSLWEPEKLCHFPTFVHSHSRCCYTFKPDEKLNKENKTIRTMLLRVFRQKLPKHPSSILT